MDFRADLSIGNALNQAEVESVLVDQLAKSRTIGREEVLREMESAAGIDSLEGLELVIEAERTFGVSISDSELARACRSVPELAAMVSSKMQRGSEKGEAN